MLAGRDKRDKCFGRGIRTTRTYNVPICIVRHPPLPSDFAFIRNVRKLHGTVRHLTPNFFPLQDNFAANAYTATTTGTTLITLLGQARRAIDYVALPSKRGVVLPITTAR